MSLNVRPRFSQPRTPGVKPTLPIRVDWANPLTVGLVELWVYSQIGVPFELVSRQLSPLSSSPPAPVVSNGLVGYSFSDGSNNYIDAADKTRFDITGALTIFTIQRFSSFGDSRALAAKGQGATATHSYSIKYHPTPNAIRASLSNSTAQSNIDGTTTPSTSDVSSAAVTWDDQDDNVAIYLNGALDGSGTFAGPLQTNTDEFMIGSVPNWTGNGEMAGEIYFVALFRVRKSAAAIRELHSNPYQLVRPIIPSVFYPPSVAAVGQPMSLRGATVPGMRQWRGGGFRG